MPVATSTAPTERRRPFGGAAGRRESFGASLLWLADEPDRSGQAAKVRAFQLFLLLHVAVRIWFWGFRNPDEPWLRAVLVGGITLCALAGLVRSWARAAALAATALMSVKLLATFAGTSNHFFIELLCVALLAFCNPNLPDERALLLAGLRWLTALVLFYSGLQKLLYGTYSAGQFLGYAIATKGTFADVFAWLLPAAEWSRLRGLSPIGVGTGPFAIDAPLAVVLSNAVYLFEMLAPPLLLWQRTRVYAALAVIAFTFGIESAARELMFGSLFVNLVLLYFVRPVNRTLLPAFVGLYIVLFAARLHLLPRLVFN